MTDLGQELQEKESKSMRITGRLCCWFTIIAFAMSMIPAASLAGEEAQELKLKRGFLRSLKFVIGEDEPRPVFDFSGLSFKPEFEKAISVHPTALEEAKKSLAWNGVALVGSMGLLAGSL